MARARIDDELGSAAVTTVGRIAAGIEGGADGRSLAASVDRTTLALAVRYTLQLLAEQAPGGTVEVRVPPYARGAVRRGSEAHAGHAAQRDRDGCRDVARPRDGRPHVGRRPRGRPGARLGPARRPARAPPGTARSLSAHARPGCGVRDNGGVSDPQSTPQPHDPERSAAVGDDVERVDPVRASHGDESGRRVERIEIDEPVETDVSDDVVTVRRAPATGGSSRSARSSARSSRSSSPSRSRVSPRIPSWSSGSTRARSSASCCCCAPRSAPPSAPSSRSSSTAAPPSARSRCWSCTSRRTASTTSSEPGDPAQRRLSTASANSRGASCGRSCPMPGELAERVRAGERSRSSAPLGPPSPSAPLSSTTVGTVIGGSGGEGLLDRGVARVARDERRSGAGTSGSRRRRSRGCRGSGRSPRRPSRHPPTRATTSSTAARTARAGSAPARGGRASEWK